MTGASAIGNLPNLPAAKKRTKLSLPSRHIQASRFEQNPIIHSGMSPVLGDNINGPSLIRVPEWASNRLGRYYLYFAHHRGDRIRLAYADHLRGPWTIHEPGTLKLDDTICVGHIASPDLLVDEPRRTIRMYFHGPVPNQKYKQVSLVALSHDGINFRASPEILGRSYFRVFRWGGSYYAMARGGTLYRSRDGLRDFEEGINPIQPRKASVLIRHVALDVTDTVLSVYHSRIGDEPECMLLSTIDVSMDWRLWKASEPAVVLEPEFDYEGAELPLQPSREGMAGKRVRELRDPAIYREEGKLYLLYSVAGESGIAIAQLENLSGP